MNGPLWNYLTTTVIFGCPASDAPAFWGQAGGNPQEGLPSSGTKTLELSVVFVGFNGL